MPTAVRETIQVLELIVQTTPTGTNLGLLYLLWTMLSGAFLSSRGAIFPALQSRGFDEGQSRRIWAAMRYGAWRIEELIEAWRTHVLREGKWRAHRYNGYRPLGVDWTAFWRPQLQGWVGKMFHRLANRALRGVGFGVIVDVGEVGEQRLPLIRRIHRIDGKDMSEHGLKKATLAWVGKVLKKDEIALLDAGVELSQLQEAGIQRFVVRLASNCTARRNFLPPEKKQGRPREKGALVRPLPRSYRGKVIPASQPDVSLHFQHGGRKIRVHGWRNLVLPVCKVDVDNPTFDIWVFFDPAFETPLVLANNVALQPQSVLALYLDRWPVEQVPLAAKQMLGLHRQFVFAPQSVLRLPELALLAGNVLTYLAAVLPPMPTGFWDRHPKKRLVASVESWLGPIFSLITKRMADFVKRTPVPGTYPRGSRVIVAENGIPDPVSPPLTIQFLRLRPTIA